MPKQPHVIVTVGATSTVMSKAAPEKYSIEAYGYDMTDVLNLFSTVHEMVRGAAPHPEEIPPVERVSGPFGLSGFTLVSKLSEGNADAWNMGHKEASTDRDAKPRNNWFDEPDPQTPAAGVLHDETPDELTTCGCATDDPPRGNFAVRINGVNHRFTTYPRARDFSVRYGLEPVSVFMLNATDADLCCFPYALPLENGTHMGFQTRYLANELAASLTLIPAEVTYHEDEHIPEHLADYEAHRTLREKVEKFIGAGPGISWGYAGEPCSDDCTCHRLALKEANAERETCSDTQCACHTQATEDEERRAADRADSIRYAVGGLVSGKIPGQRDDEAPEQADEVGSDDLGYDDRPRQRLVAAEQAAAEIARREAAEKQHPNPCLPGCSCGNGPAPLAADDPTDG